ncbi:hypothetical protein LG329_09675 [Virgibacillus necropolis]|uniref:hypothetical protein n=1 Tax=Virgibacillus necropolis TaxID=163877 RepID=UPI00384C8960
MEQQFLSVEEFNELIKQWTGKNIKISKQEIRDNDETLMKLEDISYSKDTRRIDGYEAMHAIQFNGSGKIENEDHNFKPLPSSTYEIPLEDTTQYQYDGSRFALNTDRGAYTIELED